MENSGVFTRHFWAGWSVDSSLWRCARDVKLGGGRGAVPEHDGEIKYPIWPGKPFTQKPLNFSRRNIKKLRDFWAIILMKLFFTVWVCPLSSKENLNAFRSTKSKATGFALDSWRCLESKFNVPCGVLVWTGCTLGCTWVTRNSPVSGFTRLHWSTHGSNAPQYMCQQRQRRSRWWSNEHRCKHFCFECTQHVWKEMHSRKLGRVPWRSHVGC